jgi:hypothetical protein
MPAPITCKECRWYMDGYCHALPPSEISSQLQPRDASKSYEEYMHYPQVDAENPACRYFAKEGEQ